MKSLPVELLPYWICLRLAGMLIRRSERADWRNEWLAEIWHRWNGHRSFDEWNVRTAIRLYMAGAGCFTDALHEFRFDQERWSTARGRMRTPKFCVLSLAAALMATGLCSHFFVATRGTISNLPYEDPTRLALMSRTGRLESIRQGIPANLAHLWRRDSKLIMGMAGFSIIKPASVRIGGALYQTSELKVTQNLFNVLGLADRTQAGANGPVAWVSYDFWARELHSNSKLIGQYVMQNNRGFRLAGVLPTDFWFLSSNIGIYKLGALDDAAQATLVVRVKRDISASELEDEIADVAERNEMPFTQTAPSAVFLVDAAHTPIWLFAAGLLMALVVVAISQGARLRRSDRPKMRRLVGNIKWWSFLALKAVLGLALVFVLGLELVVGSSHQISGPLGGPTLLWFYTAGCSLALLAVIADQQSRCRVCQQSLAFPIRVGCPGCLFLDWSGTELLCPDGHGMLYVPHLQASWDEAERWVALEM